MNEQMTPVDDMELLREFSRTRSDSAFASLVDRHLDMVHSAALRQTRDADLAKDVSQAVFLLLARKASSLGSGTVLAGWLYRAACFVSKDAMKAEYRRRKREQEAMNPEFERHSNDLIWEEVAPVLDDALQELNGRDRDAVLLRFLEDRSLREVGDALQISEDAAQKRVSRALEKLKEILRRRGVTASLLGIGGLLSADGAQAAPFGLKAEAALVATNGGALVGGLAESAATAMFWSQAKGWLAGGVGILLAMGGVGVFLRDAPVEARSSEDVRGAEIQIMPSETEAMFAATVRSEEETKLDSAITPVAPDRESVEGTAAVAPTGGIPNSGAEVRPTPIRGSIVTHAASSGTGVRGRVLLKGTPPPNKEFKMDPLCGRLHKVNEHEIPFYVVGPDRGLKDVVVFARVPGGGAYPIRDPALLDQVDCVFTPYVSAVQVGQTLRVRNLDELMHNVHVTPRIVPGGGGQQGVQCGATGEGHDQRPRLRRAGVVPAHQVRCASVDVCLRFRLRSPLLRGDG